MEIRAEKLNDSWFNIYIPGQMTDNVEHIGPPLGDARITIASTDEASGPPLDGGDDAPIFYEEKGCNRCCFGPIANMPFGWPKGSCTALMTYTAIVCFLGGLVGVLVYAITSNNVNIVLSVMGINASGFSFAFGHYVGNRSASKSQAKSAPSAPVVAMGGKRYKMIPVSH